MKHLSSFFAKRYLFSPKSHSVINIVSWVSAVAIGVPVAAMVILLSVFNGFEGLIKQMYSDFDPDIAISPRTGKVFEAAAIDRAQLLEIDGVEQVSFVLEDNALLEYRGQQHIGTIRGVDSLYGAVVPIERMVTAGEFRPMHGEVEQALVGEGLAYNLGVNINLYDPIRAYVPRRGAFNPLVPIDIYRARSIYPSGFFRLDAQTDGQYMIAPIVFTRELFDYPEGASAVFVRVLPSASPPRVREAIQEAVGEGFRVATRDQQNALTYTIMRHEKWGIFFIALMVMIIASFSIVGSLVMLIIEKREHMRTVVSMGGSVRFLRTVFLRQGMIIAGLGGATGMALGLVVCWTQKAFGVIRIPAQTFLVDTYPVVVQAADLLWIAGSFIVVNYVIIKLTVVRMIPRSQIRV